MLSVYHSEEDVVDKVEPEEKPKEEEPKKEEPKDEVVVEETINVTAIVIGGICVVLLLALGIVIAVLKGKKKKVGGEA